MKKFLFLTVFFVSNILYYGPLNSMDRSYFKPSPYIANCMKFNTFIRQGEYVEAEKLLEFFSFEHDELHNSLKLLKKIPNDRHISILSKLYIRHVRIEWHSGIALGLFMHACRSNIEVLRAYLEFEEAKTYIAHNFLPGFIEKFFVSSPDFTEEHRQALLDAGFASKSGNSYQHNSD